MNNKNDMEDMIMKRTGRIISLVIALSMILGSSAVCNTAYAKAKAKLSVKKITMEKGTKKNIVIKKKSKSCKYTFKSKNKKIAKVNAKGKVTAVKKGTTKITVKEKSKKTKKTRSLGTVKVIVRDEGTLEDFPPVISATPTAGVGVTSTPDITSQTPSPSPEPTVSVEIDFSDSNISKFYPEGEGVKIELSKDGYNDDSCLKATGRENRNGWFGCGMAFDITDYITAGKTYKISCYVKCDKNATMTLRSINNAGNGGFNWPSQVGNTIDVKAGHWTYMEAIYLSPDVITGKVRLYWDASDTADIYIDSIEFKNAEVIDGTFKSLFTDIFGHVGGCNTYQQMRDYKTFTTTLYNSVTMENETKPMSYLNERNVSDTVPEGYIIPESYKDSKYPVLNFQTFDNVIQTAYEYGFQIRFHVLVWHSQTPEFFFKKGYNKELGYVSKEYMEGRMEYYIRNVVNHIYNTPHGKDVVYCIDVANEYFHNYDQGSKSMWNTIYYPTEKSESDRTNKPEYVKRAFEITYDELEKLDLNGKVKLFYNDYNTYEVTEDIITMINYINEEKKICDGVGMQSHLDVDYPTPGMGGKIASTIDAFAAQGYEIQITELDVTDYDNSGKQLQYYKDLFNMLVTKKKNGVNITGVTFWGLCDSNSWRRSGKPLLFSAVFSPKPVFYEVIETAKSAWK